MSPPSGLNTIALISGGKDSLFSILHCIANGHRVVALANLHPLSTDTEDIDSFMYQTIGHHVIPLYEEALGIPLYRQEISGSAVSSDRIYAVPAEGENSECDETESLVPLLRRIMLAIPGVQAVSTGAILSTYQRTRVESVAVRLGLVPLSFLWQFVYLPPHRETSLLDDMRNVGQEARLIKVASGGLNDSVLWEDVADVRTMGRMRRAMQRFGAARGALIGEGGEFETLAVDGPRPLWKRRIEFERVERVVGEGGVAFARLLGGYLTDRKVGDHHSQEVRIPELLEDGFEKVLHMSMAREFSCEQDHLQADLDPAEHLKQFASMPPHTVTAGGFMQIANLTSTGDISTQAQDICTKLRLSLESNNLDASAIVHSTLLLRSMSTFNLVNSIYGSLFPKPNPPSRVTVACGSALPPNIDISLSVLASIEQDPQARDGLHVQSRSYWAPANIGPYSQAQSVLLRPRSPQESLGGPKMVFVAGQIPLAPGSMEVVTAADLDWKCPPSPDRQVSARMEFLAQATLSLQHLWRVGRAVQVDAWVGAVAFTSSCPRAEAVTRAQLAFAVWDAACRVHGRNSTAEDQDAETGGEVDIWDIRNGVAASDQAACDGDTRRPLPYFDEASGQYSVENLNEDGDGVVVPSIYMVQVDTLPRGVDVEWVSVGVSGTPKIRYKRMETTGSARIGICDAVIGDTGSLSTEYHGIRRFQELLNWDEERGRDALLTVYATEQVPEPFTQRYGPALIPCSGIWGRLGLAGIEEFVALVVITRFG